MGQVSSKMRRTERGYVHWCDACGEPHTIFDNWTFDGNLESPTFSPSFRHGPSIAIAKDEKGERLGRWLVTDKDGRRAERVQIEPGDTPVMWCCHYVVTAGQVAYCGDSTHAMANQTVPMPDLPEHLRDPDFRRE
jgi:hypothetical protein